jgi:hypothetical protein
VLEFIFWDFISDYMIFSGSANSEGGNFREEPKNLEFYKKM